MKQEHDPATPQSPQQYAVACTVRLIVNASATTESGIAKSAYQTDFFDRLHEMIGSGIMPVRLISYEDTVIPAFQQDLYCDKIRLDYWGGNNTGGIKCAKGEVVPDAWGRIVLDANGCDQGYCDLCRFSPKNRDTPPEELEALRQKRKQEILRRRAEAIEQQKQEQLAADLKELAALRAEKAAQRERDRADYFSSREAKQAAADRADRELFETLGFVPDCSFSRMEAQLGTPFAGWRI